MVRCLREEGEGGGGDFGSRLLGCYGTSPWTSLGNLSVVADFSVSWFFGLPGLDACRCRLLFRIQRFGLLTLSFLQLASLFWLYCFRIFAAGEFKMANQQSRLLASML